jgi:hypothetical protein
MRNSHQQIRLAVMLRKLDLFGSDLHFCIIICHGRRAASPEAP